MNSKLDDDLQARICARVRAGVPPAVAARAEEVGRSTWYNWLAVGQGTASAALLEDYPDPARYEALIAALDTAAALFECDCVEALKNPPDDWYDSRGRLDKGHVNRMTWLLERIQRERYGLRLQIEDLRDKAAEELIERLREGLDASTFERCVAVLAGEGGEVEQSGGGEVDVDSLSVH